jgi:hypothetical protein
MYTLADMARYAQMAQMAQMNSLARVVIQKGTSRVGERRFPVQAMRPSKRPLWSCVARAIRYMCLLCEFIDARSGIPTACRREGQMTQTVLQHAP